MISLRGFLSVVIYVVLQLPLLSEGGSRNQCSLLFSPEDQISLISKIQVLDLFEVNTRTETTLKIFDFSVRKFHANADIDVIVEKILSSRGTVRYKTPDGVTVVMEMKASETILTVEIKSIRFPELEYTEMRTSGIRFAKVLSPIVQAMSQKVQTEGITQVDFLAKDIVNMDLAAAVSRIGFKSKYFDRILNDAEIEFILGPVKDTLPVPSPLPLKENFFSETEYNVAMEQWQIEQKDFKRRMRLFEFSLVIEDGKSSLTLIQSLKVRR